MNDWKVGTIDNSCVSSVTASKDIVKSNCRKSINGNYLHNQVKKGCRTDGNTEIHVSQKKHPSIREKKKQTNLTLQWLEENYCMCEGVCLPRNVLYTHYLDFCSKQAIQPACAATFGKTIRQKFPHLTTRRLGTRGHSKYHYYGIGIKETSQYYHTVYSTKGITRFSDCKQQNEGGFTRKYSLSSKLGTLLPDFPCSTYLILPVGIPNEKVETFLMMYKTHCQCLLDTTIAGAFQEIETYLSHFWQGLPDHMMSLLTTEAIEDIICVCDSIFYKTMVEVLIPATMQEMPDSLLCDIRNLAHHWLDWLTSSMESLPEKLCKKKSRTAKHFSQYLKRQVSFLHLAQTARPVLYDAKLVNEMITDIEDIDIKNMGLQCVGLDLLQQDHQTSADNMAAEIMKEFKEILRKQATVEAFIEWVDSIVEKRVLRQNEEDQDTNIEILAQEFMLRWSFFGSRISHCLTLNNAKSFGSIHLIKLLLDEYMLLATESQLQYEKEKEVQDLLEKHTRTNDKNNIMPLSTAPRSCFLASKMTRPGVEHLKKETEVPDSVYTARAPYSLPGHFRHLSNMSEPMRDDSAILTPPVSPVPGVRPLNYNDPLLTHSDNREAATGKSCTSWKDYSLPGHMNPRNTSYPYTCASRYRHYDDNIYNLYAVYENYLNGNAYNSINSSGNPGFLPVNSYHDHQYEDYDPQYHCNGPWPVGYNSDISHTPYDIYINNYNHGSYRNLSGHGAYSSQYGSGNSSNGYYMNTGQQEQLNMNHNPEMNISSHNNGYV